MSKLGVSALVAVLLSGCGCGDEDSLRITTATLPDGIVGAEYETRLEADGPGDHFWGFTSGRLPPGLTLSQSGLLGGTPSAEGDFVFSVRVTSSEAEAAVADLTLHVEGGSSTIRLTTASLPDGRVGEEYSERLGADGGVEPYSFGLASGSLPPGLSLSAGGLLDGTPTDGTDTNLTVRIFDAVGGVGSGQVRLRVLGSDSAPQLDTDLLPEGQEGEEYSFTLEASGGAAPLAFSSAGDLPPGLALDAGGTLSGVPEEGGLFEVTIRVTDAVDRSSEREYYLPIEPAPLVVTTTRLPTGRTGVEYEGRLEADGGVRPYRFEILSGELPEGLSVDDDGVITGTPAVGGGAELDLRVRDADGRTAERQDVTLAVQDFFDVSPDVELPGTCDVPGSETFAVDLPVAIPGMVAEVDVGATVTFDDFSYISLALESPTGKRVILFDGDQQTDLEGDVDDFDFLDAFWDEEDTPVSSLGQFVGEPTQGTWRLIATVTATAWAPCTDGGTIDRFYLALAREPSSANYVRITGWEENNLIHVPWVRITGGGLDQDTIEFQVREWTTGENGIAEGGTGDDEDLGLADLEWSTDVDPDVGSIDEDGVFTSRFETGSGTVEGTDGDDTYEFEIEVVPPDWVP
ncbi:MAG: putative Ig domain-containing protein [Deltaproteobacteria bacterium]|nr:putative Ig domain-containing protein [Deltaproteobacteria bacterium]